FLACTNAGVPATAAGVFPGPGAAGSRQRGRVLLVDDEADVRALEQAVLESEGLACSQAHSGVAALEVVKQHPPALVLLDVDMPGLDGMEVLRRLRDHPPPPHLKIILCSGRASPDLMAQMLAAGADDFLTKPFALVQLVNRIMAALRLKQTQDGADALNR